MSQVAKLKKQAADFEAKKQFDKAIGVYVKLLEAFDSFAAELDVGLFNRVGDLLLRQGNVADAVDYYEQGIDRYSDTGFFNNAIALCNKVLRHSPGRASIYYKLGRISAKKGFTNEARTNFLEYADRMQKAGKVDEAFRALTEFADLCPDQDEIRLTLAEQLTRAGRKEEAIEQLQTLHERLDGDGRASDAGAVVDRMRAIDPAVEPRKSQARSKGMSSELVFIDLDEPLTQSTPGGVPLVPPTAPSTLVELPPAVATPAIGTKVVTPPDGSLFLSSALDSSSYSVEESGSEPLVGFEPTRFDHDVQRPANYSFEPPATLDRSTRTPFTGSSTPPVVEDRVAERIEDATAGAVGTPIDDAVLELGEVDALEPAATFDDPAVDTSSFDATAAAEPSVDDEAAPEPLAEPIEELLGGVGQAQPAHDELEVSASPASGTTSFPSPVLSPSLSVPATEPQASEGLSASIDEKPLLEDWTVLTPGRATAAPPASPLDGIMLADALGATANEGGVSDLSAGSLDEPLDAEPIVFPTPSQTRKSTAVAAESVEALMACVESAPQDWGLHRDLGEAMLDAGDRAGGIRELEYAMAGAEGDGKLDLASAIAEEVARIEPDSVKHQQKRVEYAFRTNDRTRLIEAYLGLANVLLRGDQVEKARTIYQRVLDLAPDEPRARLAIGSITPARAPIATRGFTPIASRVVNGARQSSSGTPHRTTPAARPPSGSYINLGDMLRGDDAPRDTRMVVPEQEPTGDEQADFADMLRKFKAGIARNVAPEDHQSHYDLAIAYKEMGLVDEAIAEFQKALGGPTNRLPTYEALGQCFLEKDQYKLAASILGRALTERASDDQLVGILYLLGRAAELQGKAEEALGYYQRVFVVDIQFRDIADRMIIVEQTLR